MSRLYRQYHEIPAKIIGCSAGALNAVGFSRLGPDDLLEVWDSIKSRKDVFADVWAPWNKKRGWYDSTPLRKLVRKVLNTPGHSLWSTISYAVVCADLPRQKPLYFDNNANYYPPEEWEDCIVASASIPGVVRPVDDFLADGGVFEQCPLAYAIDDAKTRFPDAAPHITVILGNHLDSGCDMSWRSTNFVKDIVRTIDGMSSEILRNDVEYCLEQNQCPDRKTIRVRVIQPPQWWSMDALAFEPAKMNEAYELGKNVAIPGFSE
jgi:predicted acylesterase/phospholipase RssA